MHPILTKNAPFRDKLTAYFCNQERLGRCVESTAPKRQQMLQRRLEELIRIEKDPDKKELMRDLLPGAEILDVLEEHDEKTSRGFFADVLLGVILDIFQKRGSSTGSVWKEEKDIKQS